MKITAVPLSLNPIFTFKRQDSKEPPS